MTSENQPNTTGLRLIKKDALGEDPNPTPGMQRAHAISVAGLTSGTVSVGPGVLSGWHHHGTHETSIHVLSGPPHLAFLPGGLAPPPGTSPGSPATRPLAPPGSPRTRTTTASAP